MRLPRVRTAAVIGIAAVAMFASACGSSGNAGTVASSPQGSAAGGPSGPATGAPSGGGSAGPVNPATATSVADFGGMSGLAAAAQKEGQLNLVAIPNDWANYGEIIKNFTAKYGIKVNQEIPHGTSAQEVQLAQTARGTDKAPDILDLGAAVSEASMDLFAPYKVQAWDEVPAVDKDPSGMWTDDYTGVLSVGYNATKFGTVTSLDQLTDPKFKGAIALDGQPTQAGAAFNGVMMASLANGGSPDNIAPGVAYFAKLKKAGTLSSVYPTAATVAAGQTEVVIDWSYNQLLYAQQVQKQGAQWKMFVPPNAATGAYYRISAAKGAAHPAAARLWLEYLYTPAAQNEWLAGGAQPILFDAMKKDGTLDAKAAASVPKTSSPVVMLTDAQQKAATAYLNANWAKDVG